MWVQVCFRIRTFCSLFKSKALGIPEHDFTKKSKPEIMTICDRFVYTQPFGGGRVQPLDFRWVWLPRRMLFLRVQALWDLGLRVRHGPPPLPPTALNSTAHAGTNCIGLEQSLHSNSHEIRSNSRHEPCTICTNSQTLSPLQSV